MVFTENTRLQEICQAEHLLPIRDCLISGGRFFEENGLLTLAQLQERSPTWNAKDLLYGLRRLEEPYKVCSVYGGEDPRMAAVKLTWLPGTGEKARDLCYPAGGRGIRGGLHHGRVAPGGGKTQ